jgi:hypothetical protein
MICPKHNMRCRISLSVYNTLMHRPLRVSCNEFAGTPMEEPFDGLDIPWRQSLITERVARRSINLNIPRFLEFFLLIVIFNKVVVSKRLSRVPWEWIRVKLMKCDRVWLWELQRFPVEILKGFMLVLYKSLSRNIWIYETRSIHKIFSQLKLRSTVKIPHCVYDSHK